MRVLMYHDVIEPGAARDSGFRGAGADHYKLDLERFREHLDELARAAPEALRSSGDAGVRLTFDDGGSSALTLIAPELERRGWSGLFFIATDWLGTPGFLSQHEVRELGRRGHVVGSHSASHPPNISALSDAELQREWQDSVNRLGELLGARVQTASVPGGYYSARVARAAEQAGIRELYTSEPTERSWQVGACRVFGRFTLTRNSPAAQAVAFARGEPITCGAQWASWNTKKLLKAVAARPYARARQVLLQARHATSG